jgi:hypothetical protein
VLAYLFNLVPIATGEIGALFVARHMPNDYVILNNYLSQHQGTYRIMGIPTISRWVIKSDRIPIVTLYDILDLEITNRFPQISDIREYSKKISFLIHQNGFLEYLSSNSVKYIIVPSRDVLNDDDFYIYFKNNRKTFIDSLDSTVLEQIDINMSELRLYENPFFRDRITLGNKDGLQTIKSTFINSSTFKIELSGITSNRVIINFSEKYDPNWKIYQPGSLLDTSILPANSVPLAHIRDLNNRNTFIVNIIDLCNQKKLLCTYKKGGYSLELSLVYEPNSFVMIGYIISTCSLVILITGSLVLFTYRYIDGRKTKAH